MVRPSDTHAISPVVGIMLMLVIVIIIAAVVSGFSGGLIGTSQKAPNIILDMKIVNTGLWTGSGFFATVVETSRPIATNDIKIVTSWTITNRTTGERETGGSTVMPNTQNIQQNRCNVNISGAYQVGQSFTPEQVAPFGGGAGLGTDERDATAHPVEDPGTRYFGAYTLVPGTTLSAPTQQCICKYFMDADWSASDYKSGVAEPFYCAGFGAYGAGQQYTYPNSSFVDSTTAVLGKGWYHLRAGDTVNVKVIYIPTNAVLFNKNILVTEG